MSNKVLSILAGVLVLQLAGAGGVWWSQDSRGAFQSEATLLAVNADEVDELRIQKGGDETVLTRAGDGWQLPDYYGFPADADRVDGLLERLAGVKKSWPIATTASAARRFKVDDEDYEVKISLRKGGESLAALYLGTSPGFRKVHARVGDADEVQAILFSTYEASARDEDWIDNGVLERDPASLSRLTVGDLVIERRDGDLAVSDLGEDEETRPEEVRRLVDEVTGLKIQKVLGTENLPEYNQESPILEIVLESEGADPSTYVLSQREGESTSYVLKSSDRPEYLQVPAYAVRDILDVQRDELVQARGEPEDGEPGRAVAAGEKERANGEDHGDRG